MPGSFERVVANAIQSEARQLAATDQALADWADVTLDMMRTGAPWTDRTGDARRRLSWGWRTAGYRSPGRRLVFRHGVPYGRHLELDHGGRFAIIIPTLASQAGSLISYIRHVWGGP